MDLNIVCISTHLLMLNLKNAPQEHRWPVVHSNHGHQELWPLHDVPTADRVAEGKEACH